MCTQETLSKLDLAGTTVGAVSGAFDSFGSSLSRKRAAKFNAQLANQNAAEAIRQGEEELRASMIQTNRLIGRQRAAFAGNNIDIAGSPTALDILADTSEEGLREGAVIMDNAARRKRGFEIEAAFETAKAKGEMPFLRGASALAAGGGKVAGKWYAFKKAGTI